ncbi:MAG: tripartite tricarboxylate transporter TctB family protein [Ruminococcaceae bacterium]|nr:tripartite tricarboxylate transporter TctB family protein [Oscillospiraceae bacterium]
MNREKTPRREPGALGFAVALLLLGAVAFAAALALWSRMSEPRVSSAAALPLFVSGLWVLMALWNALTCAMQKKTDAVGVREALRHALPPRTLALLALTASYCALLYGGVGFLIATPLFLYAAMCFLLRGDYVKNLLRAAVVTALIWLVFHAAFGVVLP